MISVSGKFTLAALTAMTTSPGPGTGDGTSSMTSVSGGPNDLQRTALKVRSLNSEFRNPNSELHASAGRLTCIDRQTLTRDIARVIAAKKHCGVCDVVSAGHAAQWRPLQKDLFYFLRRAAARFGLRRHDALDPITFDGARKNGVHGDVVTAKLEGEPVRHANLPPLRRAVANAIRQA